MALWQARDLNIFTWTLVAISFLFLLVRLYIDIKGIRRVAWYRDVMIVTSWVFFVGWASAMSITIDLNYWTLTWETFLAQDKKTMVYTQEMVFVAENLFIPIVYLVKVDLLLLFHELAPRSLYPKIFWAICAGWFWALVGFLMNVCWDLWSCPHISWNWSFTPDIAPNGCAYPQKMIICTWVVNIVSDLVIYAIPVAIIYRQQMLSMREKLSAAAMFFVGFLNVAGAFFCAAGQFILDGNDYSDNFSWAWTGVGFFMIALQCATAIWIVCMPHCKSLWRIMRKEGSIAGSSGSDLEKRSDKAGSPNSGSDAGLAAADSNGRPVS